jgi:hypothetical protein
LAISKITKGISYQVKALLTPKHWQVPEFCQIIEKKKNPKSKSLSRKLTTGKACFAPIGPELRVTAQVGLTCSPTGVVETTTTIL